MFKILKYSIFDLLRSRWSFIYLVFYLLLGSVLLLLNSNLSNAIITLLNVVTVLVPLIGTIFGIMYYYDSKEFTELLLAQPIKRSNIFLGQYFGVAISLSLSLIIGLGIPFLFYGLVISEKVFEFISLIIVGTFLTFIFTAISFFIALSFDNKIKGFSVAILMWLLLAVIYDGIFLISLVYFEQYPLDVFSLTAVMLNPIDLGRTLMLLKLDISALLGYTGAIFKKFFGTNLGSTISFIVLIIWSLIPILGIVWKSNKKDF
ncbi:MAG: ABC transporter permease [Bacteroidetes bacterium]|nr:ABC transporter permease [Bacteroidota bacterium]